MTIFEEAVLRVVRTIPKGKVMSYGQIARYIGAPKAAREVGWSMHTLGGTPDFPWWRVLNSKGKISLKEDWDNSPQTQQSLLESEGITFVSNLTIDIEKYRYHADEALRKTFLLPK